jgi:crotonobetainyl-CoA:carnitine CoA-transferase CaiB-like acyl-CoA transferase
MTVPAPLNGVRVLDLSIFLPGPFATQILGDLGADIIKVEPPTGDPGRTIGGGLFDTVNRNKRSLRLDLKDPEDRARCLELAATADVFVESFRPGVADRLGVGYGAVREAHPGIIYCSISGFGQSGPQRDRPGHDLVYLAGSGALSVPGHWGEVPRRSGVPLADLAAASYAAISILAALRGRETSGLGTHLDVAIQEAALAFASVRGGPTLTNDPRDGAHLYPANELFETSDGEMIALAAVEDHFVDRLRTALADVEPTLLDDRFDSHEGKRRHADDLHALVAAAVHRLTAAEVVARVRAHDVPGERVRSIEQAADLAEHRGIVARDGERRQVLFPVLSDGQPLGRVRNTAPDLPEDTIRWIPAGDADLP